MTEQEELEAVRKEFGSYVVAENAYREILLLRKQEICLEGQNADLRKRVAELEAEKMQHLERMAYYKAWGK